MVILQARVFEQRSYERRSITLRKRMAIVRARMCCCTDNYVVGAKMAQYFFWAAQGSLKPLHVCLVFIDLERDLPPCGQGWNVLRAGGTKERLLSELRSLAAGSVELRSLAAGSMELRSPAADSVELRAIL